MAKKRSAGRWMQQVNEQMERKGTKGAFSRWARSQGMSTNQAAQKVTENPSEYSPRRRKRAQLAKTFSRFSKKRSK